jgi:hypothetical protein
MRVGLENPVRGNEHCEHRTANQIFSGGRDRSDEVVAAISRLGPERYDDEIVVEGTDRLRSPDLEPQPPSRDSL